MDHSLARGWAASALVRFGAEAGSTRARAEGRQVDALFLAMMKEHHRGGVEMASAAATTVKDDSVRALATAIARNQRIEINELESARRRLGL